MVSVTRKFMNYVRLDEEQIGVLEERDRVFVEVEKADWKTHDNEFFGFDVDNDWPMYSVGDDSIMLNTVKLTMAKSNDSAYHIYTLRESRGSDRSNALKTAEKIEFNPTRMDSIIELPQGFYISKNDKFRNQRVWIVIEVPVGKKIGFSRNIENYNWFNVNNRNNRWDNHDDEDDWDLYNDRPEPGQEYIMTADGRPQKIASSCNWLP